MTSTIHPSDLLSAAKEHDEYLLALDEAKQWWSAEDKLTAVLTGLDDGADTPANLDQTERWERAEAMFDPEIIVGLRAYLVAEGRALPLPAPPPQPAPEPQPVRSNKPTKAVVSPPATETPPVGPSIAGPPSNPRVSKGPTPPVAATAAPVALTPPTPAPATQQTVNATPPTATTWRMRRRKKRAADEGSATIAEPEHPSTPSNLGSGTFAGRIASAKPAVPTAPPLVGPGIQKPSLATATEPIGPKPPKPKSVTVKRAKPSAPAPVKPPVSTGAAMPTAAPDLDRPALRTPKPAGPRHDLRPAPSPRPAAPQNAPRTKNAPAAPALGSATVTTENAARPVRDTAAEQVATVDTAAGEALQAASAPVRSAQHRKGNFLIGAGAVLLFVSLLGALFLRTSGTTDGNQTDSTDVAVAADAADSSDDTDAAPAQSVDTAASPRASATAPFVTFTNCGPERATGFVDNPLATAATIDVMIEFSDGAGQFNPVTLQLDVPGGDTATIDVPISALSSNASKLQCMAFVRQFEAAG